MVIETERLILREMNKDGFDALYRVLADSYIKGTNVPSSRTAVSYGCRPVDEYLDEENEITKVFGNCRKGQKRRLILYEISNRREYAIFVACTSCTGYLLWYIFC